MALTKSRLNIEEIDGSPSLFPYKLKVTNGTLTDNGDGTATLTVTGGSGSPGGSTTQLQYNDAGAFGGISGVTTNGTALTAAAIALGSDATGDIYYRNAGGNLTRLGIGTSTQVLTVTGGLPAWEDATGGGGTPGGSDTQVQFNDAGVFGGDAGLTYNKTTDLLTAVRLTVATGTITASAPAITVTQTWNNSGINFTGLSYNFINTASFGNSVLISIQESSSNRLTLTPKGTMTLTGASAGTTQNALIVAPTWNSAGIAFNALSLNVTDTASNATSTFLACVNNGVTKFSVRRDGVPTATQYLIAGGTIGGTSGPAIGGTVTWDAAASALNGLVINVTDTASATSSKLVDLLISSVSRFNVLKNGQVTMAATTVANTPLVNITGTFNSGGSNVHGLSLNITDTASFTASTYLRVQKTAVDMFVVRKDGVLFMNSGQISKVTSVSTTPYTALATDFIIDVTTTSTAITINLPTATGNAGRIYIIKDVSGQAATNNITVDASGTQLIDGTLTKIISGNFGALTLKCTGSAWGIY